MFKPQIETQNSPPSLLHKYPYSEVRKLLREKTGRKQGLSLLVSRVGGSIYGFPMWGGYLCSNPFH